MTGPFGLVYPVMAQVLLSLVLLLWTGRVRVRALRDKQVRIRDIALSGEPWPDDVKKISNNMHNQFETPVLFYALCGAAVYVGATGVAVVLLAWSYVATRLLHTAVHVTSNRVQHRFYPFAAGVLVLAAMWTVIAVRLAEAA